MSDPFDTGELPPGLRQEYLAGMRAVLGVLAAIGERLAAAGSDREALEMLQREAHKIRGSAGSYGFMDASRLAAGMEVTAKDWVAHSDDLEVDRGSLTRWFVARLAEMLGLPVPPLPPQPLAAPRPPAAAPRPMPRIGPPPRPSKATGAKPTQPPRPVSPSVRPPVPAPAPPQRRPPAPPRPQAWPQAPSAPTIPPPPPPPRAKPKAEPPPPSPPAPTPVATELPWILSPEAASEPPAAAEVEPAPSAAPVEPVAAAPPAAPEPEPPPARPPAVAPPEDAAPVVQPEAMPTKPELAPSAPPVEPVAAVPPAVAGPEPPPAGPPAVAPPEAAAPAVEPEAVPTQPEPAPSAPPAEPVAAMPPAVAEPGPPPAAPQLAAEASVAAEQAATSDVPEVIFVEDDAALAELLAYGLRTRGYRFVAYRNGREALRELIALDTRGTHPLLLLDVDLPALDGYSILAALQRDRPGTYRVVFTTVHGSEEEQLRGLEAGALDYLVKPMSLRVALEKIKRWVGR